MWLALKAYLMADPNQVITNFLSSITYVENKDKWNYKVLYPEQKHIYVEPRDLEKFWIQYCDIVSNNHPISIAERQKDVMPLIVDLLFRFNGKTVKELLYRDDFILGLVFCYQQAIINTVTITQNGVQLICCVMEPEAVITQDNVSVLHLRLQFPYCRCDFRTQEDIRSEAVLNLLNKGMIGKINPTPLDSWDKIIQHKTPSTDIPLYYSVMSSNEFPLSLMNIYNWIREEYLESDEEDMIMNLEEAFTGTNHGHYRQMYIKESMFAENDLRHWLPLFFSIEYTNEMIVYRKTEIKSEPRTIPIMNPISSNSDLALAKIFLKMLSPKRFTKECFWIEIGKALYSSCDGNAIGLQLWIEYTNRHNGNEDTKYESKTSEIKLESRMSGCRNALEWDSPYMGDDGGNDSISGRVSNGRDSKINSPNGDSPETPIENRDTQDTKQLECKLNETPEMKAMHNKSLTQIYEKPNAKKCMLMYSLFSSKNNGITYRTLAWYAREDSKPAYSEWYKEYTRSSLEKSLSGAHDDVAECLFRHCFLTYFCTSTKSQSWYHFTNHRWRHSETGASLRQYISNTFVGIYEAFRHDISGKMEHSATSEKEVLENRIEKITRLIAKLKSHPFKHTIIRAAGDFFHNPNIPFTTLLDENANLFGCEDVIIEVSGSEMFTRNGKPEDYISRSCGIKFNSGYHWNHPAVKSLLEWIGQVYPDRQLRHFWLKYSSSCIQGRNTKKIFPIWCGSGNNSKSMIIKLYEAGFGQYCIKIPITFVTGKRSQSSSPSPEIARAKGARVAFMEEPSAGDRLTSGIVKSVTGGDTYYARMCHENGGDIQAMFKINIVCNSPPVIDDRDEALEGRIVVLPHISKWVKPELAPKTLKEQYEKHLFPIDDQFEDRIPYLGGAFIWLLVNYYKFYAKEGLKIPEIVKRRTQEYWETSDIYNQFTGEKIEQVKLQDGKVDDSVRLAIAEVYSSFRLWYLDNFGKNRLPDRSMVQRELSIRWGKMSDGYWKGIKIKDTGIDNGGLALTNMFGSKFNNYVPQ